MHMIQIQPLKTLINTTTASLGLSALILTAASAAAQSDNALTTPPPGSTFDYAWDYGQIDRFTVLSVKGDRLRYRLDSDYGGDGEFDDWSIQYYQLGGRLWLSSLNPEYAIVYAPVAGDSMPIEINDGDRFVGQFSQFASDGFADWSGTFDEVKTTCDYSFPAEPYPTDFGETHTMVMACEDVQVYADGVASTDPEDVYRYSETWSLELGMPVTQSFDIDPKTGTADSVSRLVDFDLR